MPENGTLEKEPARVLAEDATDDSANIAAVISINHNGNFRSSSACEFKPFGLSQNLNAQILRFFEL